MKEEYLNYYQIVISEILKNKVKILLHLSQKW